LWYTAPNVKWVSQINLKAWWKMWVWPISRENSSSGSRVVTYRRTDMTKVIVDFHNVAKAPKNCTGLRRKRLYLSANWVKHWYTARKAFEFRNRNTFNTVPYGRFIFKRTVRMGIRLSKTRNPLHSVHIIILYCITGNLYWLQPSLWKRKIINSVTNGPKAVPAFRSTEKSEFIRLPL
jgi:hypothetical protein